MNDKNIIITARAMSIISRPFYLPIVGMLCLFFLSYMRLLPTFYKVFILLMVYFFTILLPSVTIRLYTRWQGWSRQSLIKKERRAIPYVIFIISYFLCLAIMEYFKYPRFITIIIIAALVIQVLCAMINVWWKISTHTAGMGGITGALISFAGIFDFNPTGWLCLVLILSGMVGTSRMIMRQHSLAQVTTGYLLGVITAIAII